MTPDDRERREVDEPGVDAVPGSRRPMLVLLALVVTVAAALGAWRLSTATNLIDAIPAVGRDVLTWWLDQQADDLLPAGRSGDRVAFEVGPGESLPSVAERLQAQGLLRSADAFLLLARVRGLDTQVQAGSHQLRPDMTAEEVLGALTVAAGESVTVTIPEGWRAEQIADRLAGAGLVDRSDFLRRVGAGRADRPALDDRPSGTGLEGYLFPDTYAFHVGAGAEVVIDRLLDTFEERVTPEMRGLAAAQGLSLYEAVTLASIVEREAVVSEERGRIARVFLNRLAEPPYILNADPTVQYALGHQPSEDRWWKRRLYGDDLDVDSGYNTYLYPGLPPGPIANPGLESIRSVLEPAEGSWMYFVANDVACDGSHVFALSWEEHLANVADYQTGSCGGR